MAAETVDQYDADDYEHFDQVVDATVFHRDEFDSLPPSMWEGVATVLRDRGDDIRRSLEQSSPERQQQLKPLLQHIDSLQAGDSPK
jgi:hypothetical protein